jgi:glyoxylase-like metal-dependent hydrolase (beta-lactamase superfamily II)
MRIHHLGLPLEIHALPMHGHSYGHACIAVDTGHGWLVHAGDAYLHRSVTERGGALGTPWVLLCIERLIASDYRSVRANHAKLAELAKRHDVTVFSSHDPVEFQQLVSRRGAPGDAAHTPSASRGPTLDATRVPTQSSNQHGVVR